MKPQVITTKNAMEILHENNTSTSIIADQVKQRIIQLSAVLQVIKFIFEKKASSI